MAAVGSALDESRRRATLNCSRVRNKTTLFARGGLPILRICGNASPFLEPATLTENSVHVKGLHRRNAAGPFDCVCAIDSANVN